MTKAKLLLAITRSIKERAYNSCTNGWQWSKNLTRFCAVKLAAPSPVLLRHAQIMRFPAFPWFQGYWPRLKKSMAFCVVTLAASSSDTQWHCETVRSTAGRLLGSFRPRPPASILCVARITDQIFSFSDRGIPPACISCVPDLFFDRGPADSLPASYHFLAPMCVWWATTFWFFEQIQKSSRISPRYISILVQSLGHDRSVCQHEDSIKRSLDISLHWYSA